MRSEPRGFKIKVSSKENYITYRGFFKGFKINKKLNILVCFNLVIKTVSHQRNIYVFIIIILAIFQSNRADFYISQHNKTIALWKRKKKTANNLYAGLVLVFFNSLDKTLSMREVQKIKWMSFETIRIILQCIQTTLKSS